jgi:serine/threonine-protein kinase RsbW
MADIEFASTLESVDVAEEKVLDFAKRCGVGEDDLHRIGMAVREAMVNAVVHGNKYNRNKKVAFRVERTPADFIITIGDEGQGFNPDDVPDPGEEENIFNQSGRGIMLIRAFVDEYEVGPRSGGGTQVRLVKRLNHAEQAPAQ